MRARARKVDSLELERENNASLARIVALRLTCACLATAPRWAWKNARVESMVSLVSFGWLIVVSLAREREGRCARKKRRERERRVSGGGS